MHDLLVLLQWYLNDFICVAFWIPLLVWMTRKMGTRLHDHPPSAVEILFPMIFWAALFEIVLPVWFPQIPTTADPFDFLAYFSGALLAGVFWHWYYSVPHETENLPKDPKFDS